MEVITPALFRRNPEPSLIGSVGMVNGVRPQINCSVCNTGDIHINGMEGPYTMVLIDGMPIVSGLSTVYGLSGIPTSLVELMAVSDAAAGGVNEMIANQHPEAGEMDAYERVLGDAMSGDATLFAREDYVEEAWRIVDPVLKAGTPVFDYEPQTWGPTPNESNVCPPGGWWNPQLTP